MDQHGCPHEWQAISHTGDNLERLRQVEGGATELREAMAAVTDALRSGLNGDQLVIDLLRTHDHHFVGIAVDLEAIIGDAAALGSAITGAQHDMGDLWRDHRGLTTPPCPQWSAASMSCCKWQQQRLYSGWTSHQRARTRASSAATRPWTKCRPLWTPTGCSLAARSTTCPPLLTTWGSARARWRPKRPPSRRPASAWRRTWRASGGLQPLLSRSPRYKVWSLGWSQKLDLRRASGRT